MRSFSNIMTNFAPNLHLLVDSIIFKFRTTLRKKEAEKFVWVKKNTYLCTRLKEKADMAQLVEQRIRNA